MQHQQSTVLQLWPPHLFAVDYASFRLTKDICNWLLLRCGAGSRLLSRTSKFTGAHAHTGLPSMERLSCSTQCIVSFGSVQSTICCVSTQLAASSSQSHVVASPCARIWHAAPLPPALPLLACNELTRAGDGARVQGHPLMLRSISMLTVAFPQTRRTRTFVEEGGALQRNNPERERERDH